jgi:hypothetical protein
MRPAAEPTATAHGSETSREGSTFYAGNFRAYVRYARSAPVGPQMERLLHPYRHDRGRAIDRGRGTRSQIVFDTPDKNNWTGTPVVKMP